MEIILIIVALGKLWDYFTGQRGVQRGTTDEELRKVDVLHGGFDG